MDVATFKSQMQVGTIYKFYVFTGVEWKVQQIYIKQLAKIKHLDVVYIDSISDIYAKLKNKSFLVSSNYLYVVRDDKDIMTDDKLQKQIETLLGDNILIMLLSNVDKRTKFYKDFNSIFVDFEPLKPEILKKYIKKEADLSDKNINKLMEICEYDYGRCLLEIDKLKLYMVYAESQGYDMWYDESFEYLLKDGTIHIPPKDAIFEFVDAILDGKVNKSFELYAQCLAVGEATLVMLSVLYNNAKAVLQVQTCESKDIAKSTGLTSWQIMQAKKHLNIYTNDELIRLLSIIQKCEKGIKTGTMEEQWAMEYVLIKVM